jgi:hypothetical protein
MQNDLSVKVREIVAGHFGVDPVCLTRPAFETISEPIGLIGSKY